MLGIACLGMLVIVTLVGVGGFILIKLGVITSYALREEPPDQSSYGLDQSHEAGD
jgi:hypothetical protein